jgi:hypothetical protein
MYYNFKPSKAVTITNKIAATTVILERAAS